MRQIPSVQWHQATDGWRLQDAKNPEGNVCMPSQTLPLHNQGNSDDRAPFDRTLLTMYCPIGTVCRVNDLVKISIVKRKNEQRHVKKFKLSNIINRWYKA